MFYAMACYDIKVKVIIKGWAVLIFTNSILPVLLNIH